MNHAHGDSDSASSCDEADAGKQTQTSISGGGSSHHPDRVEHKFHRALRHVQYLKESLDYMGAELDRLRAKIEPMKTAAAGMKAVLVDYHQRYLDAKGDAAATDAITEELGQFTDQLVADTVANTREDAAQPPGAQRR